MRKMQIAGRPIGRGERTFVIAEIGLNHNGDMGKAKEMIASATECGADSVKFQTYKTESFIAKGNPYYEVFRNSEFSRSDDLLEIAEYSRKLGIIFFSSATDMFGLEKLIELDTPVIKLSSANITNTPLLNAAAATGKPIIISTGATTMSEVAEGYETLETAGAQQIALLKCTSIYPCPPEYVNLKAMSALASAFDCPVGYSDHTVGVTAAVAAVTLGACVIEKHFTFDKNSDGPDHHFSADPPELAAMVAGIREAEQMVGSSKVTPVGEEWEFRAVGRRFITALQDIQSGEQLQSHLLAVRRPAGAQGLPPSLLSQVVGRVARRKLVAGQAITWEDI